MRWTRFARAFAAEGLLMQNSHLLRWTRRSGLNYVIQRAPLVLASFKEHDFVLDSFHLYEENKRVLKSKVNQMPPSAFFINYSVDLERKSDIATIFKALIRQSLSAVNFCVTTALRKTSEEQDSAFSFDVARPFISKRKEKKNHNI